MQNIGKFSIFKILSINGQMYLMIIPCHWFCVALSRNVCFVSFFHFINFFCRKQGKTVSMCIFSFHIDFLDAMPISFICCIGCTVPLPFIRCSTGQVTCMWKQWVCVLILSFQMSSCKWMSVFFFGGGGKNALKFLIKALWTQDPSFQYIFLKFCITYKYTIL